MKIFLRRSFLLTFLAIVGSLAVFHFWTSASNPTGDALEEEIVPEEAPRSQKESPRVPPKRGPGKYRGSTGEHAFYHAQARNWHVDPKVVRQQCRDTNFTQCNPPKRRSNAARLADRSMRIPFQVVDYRRFPHSPTPPDFEGCDYDNCHYTGRIIQPETDAVFIYGVDLMDDVPLPTIRLQHQTFIFASWEPVAHNWAEPFTNPKSKWNLYFNATMTYRVDSDIRFSYGKLDFQPRKPDKLPDYLSITRNKTKTAVWMVSNCGPTPSKRMAYVREMQKHIDIDIFGHCGMACELNHENCVSDFQSTYRFYLAFENSFCTDYISEKFFKLFVDGSHIVPVVRGAVPYSREFPKKTLVDAANFKHPRDLALFLKDLSKNEKEYSSYLEVKDRYRAVTFGNRWCYVCEYLHKQKETDHKTVNLKQTLRDGHVLNPDIVWQ